MSRMTEAQISHNPVSSIKVSVIRCKFPVISSFWERVWGSAEYHAKVKCNIAEGPIEFSTQPFRKSTKVQIDETFLFILPEDKDFEAREDEEQEKMEVSLYKGGIFCAEQTIEVPELDSCRKIKLKFDREQIKMHLTVERLFRTPSNLRHSFHICHEEKATLDRRKSKILQNMGRIFKENERSRNENEVPTISLLCSGGGLRAAITLCGAMEALQETGILDLVSYVSGLSGGAWYLFTAYSNQALGSGDDLQKFHTELKTITKTKYLNTILNLSNFIKYKQYKRMKEQHGQPVTFVDFCGFTLGRSFLHPEKFEYNLSSLVPYVETGNVPIPIVKAIHARPTVPTSSYHADLEITPWEISMPNYAVNLSPKDFGSEWYKGCIVRACPEPPLHFFYGVVSSALGLLFKFYLDGQKNEAEAQFVADIRKHKFGDRRTVRRKSMKRRYSRRATLATSSESNVEQNHALHRRALKNYRHHSRRSNSVLSNEISSLEDAFKAAHKTPLTPTQEIQESSTQDTNKDVEDLIVEDDWILVQNAEIYDDTHQTSSDSQRRKASVAVALTGPSESSSGNEDTLRKILRKMSHHPVFTDREAVFDRTGKVLNFTKGLPDFQYRILNPDHQLESSGDFNDSMTNDDVIGFVDAALIGNLPVNSVLRSERKSDVLIVCDATHYKSDTHIDYLQLFIAERLAKQQGLKFPRIDPEKLKQNPRGVVHIFSDDLDPECPTVIWFTLSNRDFKRLKNVTQPELRLGEESYKLPPNEKFNDFRVFGGSYTTFKSGYSPLEFDRLRELMKYNVKSNSEKIKFEILRKIKERKNIKRYLH